MGEVAEFLLTPTILTSERHFADSRQKQPFNAMKIWNTYGRIPFKQKKDAPVL
jgi:hypothetical protein